MNKACASKPDTDERGDKLTQTNAVGRLENVQILKDIRYCHQPQSAREP